VAYFYFDFENTAVIVSDTRACIELQASSFKLHASLQWPVVEKREVLATKVSGVYTRYRLFPIMNLKFCRWTCVFFAVMPGRYVVTLLTPY
jgi:hypothetical protein